MKPYAGRHVEVEIGVVDPVQPPKRRHRMEHDVLKIDDEIEQQQRDGKGRQGRHRDQVQKSPGPLFRDQGDADRRAGDENSQYDCVHDQQAQVMRPAFAAGEERPPARRGELPKRHRREDRAEGRQPYQCFRGHNRGTVYTIQVID